MDKYYTPQLEEFCIGFECEFKNSMQNNVWTKEICDSELVSIAYDMKEHEDIDDKFEDAFRVKFLDKEDIESLGFKYKNEVYTIYSNPIYAQWNLKFYSDNTISIIFYHPDDSKGELHFHGKIKNKSELKKLMYQLQIINE